MNIKEAFEITKPLGEDYSCHLKDAAPAMYTLLSNIKTVYEPEGYPSLIKQIDDVLAKARGES